MTMSSAAIARERAKKAALAANMAEEANEVEACETFFTRTGGSDCWSQKVTKTHHSRVISGSIASYPSMCLVFLGT